MKLLFDFFPVVIFFVIYKFYGDIPADWIAVVNQLPLVEFVPNEPKHAILMATLGIIVATLLQNLLHYLKYRRLERMHVVSLVLLLAFGTLTIALRDGTFIIWKASIINWVFALVFLGSEWVGERKTLVERMMSQALQVPKAIWLRVNRMWVAFFIILGLLNLIVAYTFSEQAWVNFKLFGMFGLTLVFVIGQALYMQRYALDTNKE